jgi:hypothetical protein
MAPLVSPYKNSRVALIGGAWSSNIGNAFYNIGAEWLLREIGLNVSFSPENPRWKQDVLSHYDPIAELDCDLFVLVGPCLWSRLAYVYEDTFRLLYERGKKVAYLSAGMATYSNEEMHFVSDFFRRFPPAFVSTRDHKSFDLLAKGSQFPFYDGLCTSMFLNDAIRPIPLKRKDYVVFNFDHEEPALAIDEKGVAMIQRRKNRVYPLWVGDKEIIRTNNLSIDEGYSAIYKRPNSYHSDLPQGYCSILASADTVYSERVHTCAATLIYGGKAQFIRQSPRSFENRSLLFDRVGASSIFQEPTRLDLGRVEREKETMAKFVAKAVESLLL